MCVLSVFILGLLTYAFEAVKVYRCELFTSHFVFSFLSFPLCSFHVSPEDAKGRFDKRKVRSLCFCSFVCSFAGTRS